VATNEIFKYGAWLSLPLPLRGDDPAANDDPTRNGDPVLIGDIVGFAQEVGGVPVVWPAADDPNASKSTVTFAMSRNTANSLEPGWASVALCGAFCYPVDGWDPMTMGSGTPVGISAATTDGTTAVKARLVANSPEDHWFGVIVGQTKLPYPVDYADADGNPITVPEGTYVPIVNISQTMEGRANPVADKLSAGS
jgi:hypothetical protein